MAAPSSLPASSPPWAMRQAATALFLLLWSAGFPVSKLGLQHASPMALLSVRYALTLSVLALLFVFLRPPLPRRREEWLKIAVVGFFIQVAYFGLSYLAIRAGISASALAMVASLQPILVAMLAPRLMGERVGGRQWLGLALGLGGAVGVILARSSVAVDSWAGLLLAVGALVGMTSAMLFEKRFGVVQHPVTTNLIQYAVGLGCCAPLAFFVETPQLDWTPTLFAALGYLVVGNSLIAISLLIAMIRWGEAARVASLFFFVPPTSAVISMLLLDEAMPPLAWASMVLAVAGVALATSAPRRAKAPD